jgi:hypothetical protein
MNRRLQHYAMTVILFGFASGCGMLPPCSGPGASPAPASPSAAVLQERVKEQDKRIIDLTTQLNMLKRIDQGRMKER